jgi:outer membrane protein
MSRLITRVLFATLWLPMVGIAQTSTQTPAAPAAPPFVVSPAKLAWIDLDGAIITCDLGKKEFGELQKYLEAKKTEMDNLKKEVDDLQNKLNVQGSKLTDEAREDLQYQLETKNTSLQRFQQDAQKDVDNRRQRIGNSIGQKMLPVIKKVAEEKGLSSVQIFNQNRDAYIDPSLNLTDDVVKAFNAANAAGAKAPESTIPAKKP